MSESTQVRSYQVHEFCEAVNCSKLIKVYNGKKCICEHDYDCIQTAKQFHHWLNANGFLLMKPISGLPTEPPEEK